MRLSQTRSILGTGTSHLSDEGLTMTLSTRISLHVEKNVPHLLRVIAKCAVSFIFNLCDWKLVSTYMRRYINSAVIQRQRFIPENLWDEVAAPVKFCVLDALL